MHKIREFLLDMIEVKATRRREKLICELARCAGEDRLAAQAELEFQRWFIDSCWDCMDGTY